jgi:hypothetical protein
MWCKGLMALRRFLMGLYEERLDMASRLNVKYRRTRHPSLSDVADTIDRRNQWMERELERRKAESEVLPDEEIRINDGETVEYPVQKELIPDPPKGLVLHGKRKVGLRGNAQTPVVMLPPEFVDEYQLERYDMVYVYYDRKRKVAVIAGEPLVGKQKAAE